LTWLVFVTHLLGLSLLGLSFRVSFLIPLSNENQPPTSLWRGEGQMRACMLAGGDVDRAHTSREGRGLFLGGWMWMRVNQGCEGASGGSGG